MFDMGLNDIRAMPNPANFGDPVKITAVFGNNNSSSQINATPNDLSTSTVHKLFQNERIISAQEEG